MNEQWMRGFEKRCHALGVNPEAMIKIAASEAAGKEQRRRSRKRLMTGALGGLGLVGLGIGAAALIRRSKNRGALEIPWVAPPVVEAPETGSNAPASADTPTSTSDRGSIIATR